MIRNTDGTTYTLKGNLNQYSPNSKDKDLFDKWDQEAIKIGGSPILYYEVFALTGDLDPLYLENRSKLFSTHPVQLYCYYEPVSSQNFINTFGIDSPDELLFEFNYKSVLETLGHLPKPGSRIYTPHKGENWMIIQSNLSEYKLWGTLRLQILCSKFQESLTTGEGNVAKNPINKIKID
jgi:hypothetical protein